MFSSILCLFVFLVLLCFHLILHFSEELRGSGCLRPHKSGFTKSGRCLSKLDHSGLNFIVCQDFSVSLTVKLCVHCGVWFVSIRIVLDLTIVTVMDVLNELKVYGESLGLKDEELKKSISEQQAIQREERQRERELEQKRLCHEAEKEKVLVELEKEKLWHEIEQMRVEKEYESQQVSDREFQSDQAHGQSMPKAPKLLVFDDVHDGMDSFLLRFERYAEARNRGEENWAIKLSALLRGKALDVYALMPKTDALIYQSLKTVLLRRFELTDDGFKTKFRSCRPEQCETFAQFSARLSSYFDRWIEMAKVPRTFDGLYDLMLGDQFIHICSQDLRLFPKERIPDNLQKMADFAYQIKVARNISAVQAVDKSRSYSQKKTRTTQENRET